MAGNKTAYSSMKENELYLLFQADSWRRMGVQQRLQALQEIENRFADRAGRTACEIRIIPRGSENDDCCGYMDYHSDGGPAIYMNDRYFSLGAEAAYLAATFNSVTALDTLLHEGRHCYQTEAVLNGSADVDADTLRAWAASDLHYYDGSGDDADFAVYQFQPIERDANHFAGTRIKDIYRHIVMLTGERDAEFEAALDNLCTDRQRAVEGVELYLDGNAIAEYKQDLTEILDGYYYAEEDCQQQMLMALLGLEPEATAEAVFRDLDRIVAGRTDASVYLDGLDRYREELHDFSDLADDIRDFDAWLCRDFTPLKDGRVEREKIDRKLDRLDHGMHRFV